MQRRNHEINRQKDIFPKLVSDLARELILGAIERSGFLFAINAEAKKHRNIDYLFEDFVFVTYSIAGKRTVIIASFS